MALPAPPPPALIFSNSSDSSAGTEIRPGMWVGIVFLIICTVTIICYSISIGNCVCFNVIHNYFGLDKEEQRARPSQARRNPEQAEEQRAHPSQVPSQARRNQEGTGDIERGFELVAARRNPERVGV